eukprot:1701274-Amphidinium_carterae.1
MANGDPVRSTRSEVTPWLTKVLLMLDKYCVYTVAKPEVETKVEKSEEGTVEAAPSGPVTYVGADALEHRLCELEQTGIKALVDLKEFAIYAHLLSDEQEQRVSALRKNVCSVTVPVKAKAVAKKQVTKKLQSASSDDA